jgi:hypothetical protein
MLEQKYFLFFAIAFLTPQALSAFRAIVMAMFGDRSFDKLLTWGEESDIITLTIVIFFLILIGHDKDSLPDSRVRLLVGFILYGKEIVEIYEVFSGVFYEWIFYIYSNTLYTIANNLPLILEYVEAFKELSL